IWALPLAEDPHPNGARQPFPVIKSEFDEWSPHVSPDGHWIAYASDVTGSYEVYVRRLTAEGKVAEATRVSIGGGLQPRWAPNGRELFFVSAPQGYSTAQMMAVPVNRG